MLIWIIEVILTIVLLRAITSIGLKGSCGIMAAVCGIQAIAGGAGLMAILYALIHGVILGVIAYFAAKIFLFLIDLFGAFIEVFLWIGLIALIVILIF